MLLKNFLYRAVVLAPGILVALVVGFIGAGGFAIGFIAVLLDQGAAVVGLDPPS